MEIKYIELFGGIGGISYGIKKASKELCNKNKDLYETTSKDRNKERQHSKSIDDSTKRFTCVGYYEIDKYAVQTFNKNFGTSYEPKDIRQIQCKDIPDFNLLCAGFPCQAFSIAGKREGFKDTRGTLFFEIARIAKAKKPDYLLLENVKGLLNHDKGKTFRIILQTLDELGYDIEWMVLNSKNFGVPQNRERVFIIGCLRGKGRQKVFPFGQSDKEFDEGYARKQVASSLQSPGHASGNYKGMNMIYIGRTNEVDWAKDGKNLSRNAREGYRCYSEEGISPSLRANIGGHAKGSHIIHQKTSKTIRIGGLKSPHGSKQNWDSYEINNRIRRLTPTECERLQGFPDGWTEGVSDTQRYKQLGNAVTTNVIEAIIRRMDEVLLHS